MTASNEAQLTKLWEAADSLASTTHRAGTLSVDVLKKIIRLLPGRDILSIETGCGKSTILFSNVARHHTVFCYDDRTLAGSSVDFVTASPYFVADRTTFVFGPTQQTLPRHQFAEGELFDLALIDGPHGFPFPEMEFWHLYPRLAPGALLVIDDLMIPSISRMYDILREDRMFDEVAVFSTTGVLRRSHDTELPRDGDHWWEQAYNFRRFPLSMKQYERDTEVALGRELDFSMPRTAKRHCMRGFDHRDQDGIVTIDTSSVVHLRLPGDIGTTARLTIRLQMEEAEVGGSIVVNGHRIAALPMDALEHDISVPCPVAARGDCRIEFHLPEVKPAHDRRNNYDFRRYGCTVRSITIGNDATPSVEGSHVPLVHAKPAAAPIPGNRAGPNENAAGAQFNAVLRRLVRTLDARKTAKPGLREVAAPPILCPRRNSPVRFLPLGTHGTLRIAEGLGPLWQRGKRWAFADLAAFEGVDFAYAVCRSLLHRSPTKRQIRAAESRSVEVRLLLLLEVDRKARRIGGLGKLVGLSGTRMLYRVWRTCRKLKLAPLAAALRTIIGYRARGLFTRHHQMIVQRRLELATLNALPEREDRAAWTRF